MQTLHLVSHTHWDREWYRPFQSFRLQLVHLIDNLLEILAGDPEFHVFMLDGQTIVLEDYLRVRPEREGILKEYVRAGRLLVGPWHILPDEFLVSPEATIRNLLKGGETASRFGARMAVGYTPDPFGHIGQLPQILNGFGIRAACLQRGLSTEPAELWWDAPDGTRVFLAYLRDGYGNGSILTFKDLRRSVAEFERIRNSLSPHAQTSHLLVMQGTDHMEAVAETPAGIRFANQSLEDCRVLQSTLPAYLEAVQVELDQNKIQLPVITGELRSPQRHPLLPGVLSARIWIKQRNHASQQLLERWAEPFSTLASLVLAKTPPSSQEDLGWIQRVDRAADILQTAWDLLMECHPHDSICGCSIDQVHAEMLPRFDQVDQIAEAVTQQSLQTIGERVNTDYPGNQAGEQAFIVFNPSAYTRTDPVEAIYQAPDGIDAFEIVDEAGVPVPHQILSTRPGEAISHTFTRTEVLGMLWLLESGEFPGGVIQQVSISRKADELWISVVRKNSGAPNGTAIQRALAEFDQYLADTSLKRFHVQVFTSVRQEIRFLARDVPGIGYRTFWTRPAAKDVQPAVRSGGQTLENEFFRIHPDPSDGTLTVLDKRNGTTFAGLNRFVDGGDGGDEYNYNPPARDRFVSPRVKHIRAERTGKFQSIEVSFEIETPISLSADRQSRSEEVIRQEIVTRITLSPGVPRIDIRTVVENQAKDHRLRVHFPFPFSVQSADYDGHFEVIRRPVGVESADSSWIEMPRPEKPQRLYTDVTSGDAGLMIANRGLPEIEVSSPDGETGELELTLLRCVGWLSRGDLQARNGDAGPSLETPEAQMPGRWVFDYAIIPHSADWQVAFTQAQSFSEPLRAIAAGQHPGPMHSKASLVSVQPEVFSVSALKASQDRNGWILRGANLLGEPVKVEITPFDAEQADKVRLDESSIEPLSRLENGKLRVTVRGKEIFTVKFSSPEVIF